MLKKLTYCVGLDWDNVSIPNAFGQLLSLTRIPASTCHLVSNVQAVTIMFALGEWLMTS